MFRGIEIPQDMTQPNYRKVIFMKTVYLNEFKNQKEREILKLLKAKGQCLYGDIFKQLSISATEGQHIIFSMLSRGLIKYKYRSSNIELNVDLK